MKSQLTGTLSPNRCKNKSNGIEMSLLQITISLINIRTTVQRLFHLLNNHHRSRALIILIRQISKVKEKKNKSKRKVNLDSPNLRYNNNNNNNRSPNLIEITKPLLGHRLIGRREHLTHTLQAHSFRATTQER